LIELLKLQKRSVKRRLSKMKPNKRQQKNRLSMKKTLLFKKLKMMRKKGGSMHRLRLTLSKKLN